MTHSGASPIGSTDDGRLVIPATVNGRQVSLEPDATHDDIRHYMAGNLCRCGSYVKILDAVADLLERRRPERTAG